MLYRVIFVLINTHDNGLDIALCRCWDDDFFGPGLDVGLGLVLVGKTPGGFNNILHPQASPRNIRRLPVVENLNVAAVDNDTPLISLNLFVIYPHDRIVLEQVGQGPVIGKVVDGDDLYAAESFIFAGGSKNGPADPAKTVDANFYSHCATSSTNCLNLLFWAIV